MFFWTDLILRALSKTTHTWNWDYFLRLPEVKERKTEKFGTQQQPEIKSHTNSPYIKAEI